MRQLVVGLLAAVLAVGVASAAPATGPLIRVSGASPFHCPSTGSDPPTAEIEPVVDVNPTDAANVVGIWMQDRARGMVAGVSLNGGREWRQVPIAGLTRCTGGTFDHAVDPWLSFGPDGTLYAAASVFEASSGTHAILTSRSTDGGLTWNDPITVETDPPGYTHDRAAITADPHRAGTVYQVWSRFANPQGQATSGSRPERAPIFFSESTDAGRTWKRPRKIFIPHPDHLTAGNQIVVTPDANLIDAFTLIDRSRPEHTEMSVAVVRSTNHGRHWSRPTIVGELGTTGITDPETGDPVSSGRSLSDIAVDPITGRLYVVWQDARFSHSRADGIAMSMSSDGGRTWTEPAQVNATQTGVGVENQQAFTPSVDVSSDGVAAVSYFDFRRNDAAAPLRTDRWLVRICGRRTGPTHDDARGTEARLTDDSFDLRQAPQFNDAGLNGYFVGDYMGLTHAGNDFITVFSQPHDSDPASVFARRITGSARRTHDEQTDQGREH